MRIIDTQCGFPGGSVVKNLPANAGDVGSVPELGRSSEGGNGNPLQDSCLGNPMERSSLPGYSAWVCKELGMTCKELLMTEHAQITCNA